MGFRATHTWVSVLALPLTGSKSVEMVMSLPPWVFGEVLDTCGDVKFHRKVACSFQNRARVQPDHPTPSRMSFPRLGLPCHFKL